MSYVQKLCEWFRDQDDIKSIQITEDVENFTVDDRGMPVIKSAYPLSEAQAEALYKVVTGIIPSEDITNQVL
jgi:hypothetical protein